MQVDHFPALMRAKQHQAEERNENGNKTNPFENEIRFLSEEGPDAEHAESVGRHHQQVFVVFHQFLEFGTGLDIAGFEVTCKDGPDAENQSGDVKTKTGDLKNRLLAPQSEGIQERSGQKQDRRKVNDGGMQGHHAAKLNKFIAASQWGCCDLDFSARIAFAAVTVSRKTCQSPLWRRFSDTRLTAARMSPR